MRLPGGDDQLVVAEDRAVVREHLAREAVDPHDPHARVQRDVVLGVPGQRVEVDLLGVLAREDVGEHDPVVVAVRLVTEHRDAGTARRRRGRGSPRPRGRPPCRCRSRRGADARPPGGRCHRHTSTSPRSTTTVPVSPSGAASCSSSTVPSSMSSTTRERDVRVGLGADREVAHRGAVADEHDRDQLVGAVAAAEVQRLRGDPGRHGVGEAVVQQRPACPPPGLRTGRSPGGSGASCAWRLLGWWVVRREGGRRSVVQGGPRQRSPVRRPPGTS